MNQPHKKKLIEVAIPLEAIILHLRERNLLDMGILLPCIYGGQDAH